MWSSQAQCKSLQIPCTDSDAVNDLMSTLSWLVDSNASSNPLFMSSIVPGLLMSMLSIALYTCQASHLWAMLPAQLALLGGMFAVVGLDKVNS